MCGSIPLMSPAERCPLLPAAAWSTRSSWGSMDNDKLLANKAPLMSWKSVSVFSNRYRERYGYMYIYNWKI